MKTIFWSEKRPAKQLVKEPFLKELEELSEVVYIEGQRKYSEDEAVEVLRDADILINCWGAPYLSKEILDRCPKLKCFFRIGGSIKAVIDRSALDRGIIVSSALDAQAQLLSELTLTLMLAGLHRIPQHVRKQWGGAPLDNRLDDRFAPQRTLIEKKVCLIGFGAIAQYVAKLLEAFQCEVYAYDPYMDPEVFKQYKVTQIKDLKELCALAEVLSIHAAYTKETYHLINGELLAQLPHGALIVNTSYGELIDQAALEEHLKDYSLNFCCDMLENGMPDEYKLIRYYPNSLITPSISGYSDGLLLMGRQAVEEAIRFIKGEPLKFSLNETFYQYRA